MTGCYVSTTESYWSVTVSWVCDNWVLRACVWVLCTSELTGFLGNHKEDLVGVRRVGGLLGAQCIKIYSRAKNI